MTTADQSSADDLNRKREIADGLQSVWQNSEGDRRHDYMRNHPTPGGYEGSDD